MITQDEFEAMYAVMIAKKKGDSPSSWAKQSCEKAQAKGIFNGDGEGNYNWQDPMTREVQAVTLDNAGLLD